jgi:hypothetical protein
MEMEEVLFKAADVLERDGWCQGACVNSQGQHCAVGAIMQVLAEADAIRVRPFSVLTIVENHLMLEDHASQIRPGNAPSASVVCWNDQVGRTEGEVIETLRAAASRVASYRTRSETPAPAPSLACA